MSHANGGFNPSKHGRPPYRFSEPETGWEAFISGRPGRAERDRAIADDAFRRLGIEPPAPPEDDEDG